VSYCFVPVAPSGSLLIKARIRQRKKIRKKLQKMVRHKQFVELESVRLWLGLDKIYEDEYYISQEVGDGYRKHL
jgi:hypothetical protein